MAYADNVFYVNYGNGSSTGYYAVTQWAANTAKSVGALVRQKTTPANGSERVFVCVVAGTTSNPTEPTWTTTRGGKTTDNTVTWQECTGSSAMNGDATNTPNWTTVKNTAVSIGQIIKDNGGLRYFICDTAGTAGNGAEPTWNTTPGVTTADNTVTWRCLGTVGSFSAWGAPIPRLAIATGGTNFGQANNTIYVASAHAETQTGNMTLGGGGSSADAPYKIVCVNAAGSMPPVSADVTTGATVTTTSSGTMSISCIASFFGIAFSCGSGATSAAITLGSISRFINCSFTKAGTSGNAGAITTNASLVMFDNTTVQFGNTNDSLSLGGNGAFVWSNTASALQGATIPTTLIKISSSSFIARGVDFSAVNTTLLSYGTSGNYAQFVNCKLHASVTRVNALGRSTVADAQFINCDSGATNYKHSLENNIGTQTVETTIVRTGGATDGTTPISWKIVTTSIALFVVPFESQEIVIWNDTTGSNVTVTVYGIWGGGAVPTNEDIWMEVQYQGSATSPLATIDRSTRKANILATAAGHASDTSTWGGSTTKFKMVATLSSPQPQAKGPIFIRIYCAKPSTTFYIDPLPVLS